MVIVSLAVTLILGVVYILWRWAARADWVDGTLRCVTFSCAMVAVHVWGYQAYRRQFVSAAVILPPTGAPSPLDYARPTAVASSHGVSWLGILAQQAFALLFGSILLDGGELLRLFVAGMAVYWVAVLMGFVLHRGQVTATDRVLLNVGYWPLAAFIALAQNLVWAMKGL